MYIIVRNTAFNLNNVYIIIIKLITMNISYIHNPEAYFFSFLYGEDIKLELANLTPCSVL